MTEKNKYLPLTVVIITTVVLCAVSIYLYILSISHENELIAYGICGENVSWALTGNRYIFEGTYTLTISGTGDMYDMEDMDQGQPWYEYAEKITTVIINEGVTSIGQGGFMGCYMLENISIPDSLAYIGPDAFTDSSITTFVIPEGQEIIEYCTFFFCKDLKEVYIPSSVTVIDDNAFGYCESLTDIYYEGTEEEWEEIYISDMNGNDSYIKNCTIHFEYGS